MPTSHAMVPTDHADRYIQQLCKHWAHKFETECAPSRGRIALPLGEVIMAAKEGALSIEVNAAAEQDIAILQQVVQSHVERFAFRESLVFDWTEDDTSEHGNAKEG